MSALAEIRARFEPALREMCAQETEHLLEMIRPAQDSRFGDYQVNSAMSLAKRLGGDQREVAVKLLETVDVDGFCAKTEVAGPGFINLTISDDWIRSKLATALGSDRLGVAAHPQPQTIVIDFSSPNVAKPMHVGHIRSTVIGDALARILRFAGHHVITDNHLGDWGTQFGMIIYGYKHFVDADRFASSPIDELLRLYRLVRKIADFHSNRIALPGKRNEIQKLQDLLDQMQLREKPADKKEARNLNKEKEKLAAKIDELTNELDSMQASVEQIENDPNQVELFNKHSAISDEVLRETALLHAGDEQNLALWNQFLPACRQDIQRIYDRLNVAFDHELGESFYHDQLAGVVESLEKSGLLSMSEGAACVFLDQFESPMIVRKQDGAFLYSTTDLATVQYRMQHWKPDTVLYVVDHRQHEHFAKLFDVSHQWGFTDVDLRHISFGTILDEKGKPYKTRAGDTVGLEGLINTAVEHALEVVEQLDDSNPEGPQLDAEHRARVAEVVGVGSLKYADLSQNRTSDYKFSYKKMVNLKGNTATYLQYCYARVQGIYRKGGIDIQSVLATPVDFLFEQPEERKLALKLLQFSEAIDEVQVDYKPNLLAQYLYELANTYNSFFDNCPVLKADEPLRQSRLQLCELTGRTIRTGLGLLGIEVVDRM